MQLLQVYQTDSDIEVLVMIITVLLFAGALFATIMSAGEWRWKRYIVSASIAVLLGFGGVWICYEKEPITVYKYHVTKPSELGVKLDSGYEIYQNDRTIYDLIKK